MSPPGTQCDSGLQQPEAAARRCPPEGGLLVGVQRSRLPSAGLQGILARPGHQSPVPAVACHHRPTLQAVSRLLLLRMSKKDVLLRKDR